MTAMDDKIEDGPRAEHVQDHVSSGDEKTGRVTQHHLQQLTAAELAVEKQLKKKIDLRIMPICVLIYLMNYIDR